jgi:hypothetical protein
VDAKELRRLALSQLSPLDRAMDLPRQMGLELFLRGVGKSQVSKNVAGRFLVGGNVLAVISYHPLRLT